MNRKIGEPIYSYLRNTTRSRGSLYTTQGCVIGLLEIALFHLDCYSTMYFRSLQRSLKFYQSDRFEINKTSRPLVNISLCFVIWDIENKIEIEKKIRFSYCSSSGAKKRHDYFKLTNSYGNERKDNEEETECSPDVFIRFTNNIYISAPNDLLPSW